MTDWLTHIKNSPVGKLNPHLIGNNVDKEVKAVKARKSARGKSKAKEQMHLQLFAWCKDNNLELLEEYRFHEFRKFRFDFAIKKIMVAIEFEGGIFDDVSGHKNVRNFQKDVEKYNLAQSLGWRVLRFTALNSKDVIQELEKYNE